MKFELQAGEQKLASEEVELVADRRTYPATLIVTNRRLVLTYAKTPGIWLWAFFWYIALFRKAVAHAREHLRHQIQRDRFASVEQGDGTILVFHDSGEGYAHTSFAVTSHTSLAVWQQRMERWADGNDDVLEGEGNDDKNDDDSDDLDAAAALPRARIIDR